MTNATKEVWRVYDAVAEEFDRERGRDLMERGYLDAVADGLKSDAEILDVGCGSGEPIARYLMSRGFRVIGVDASAEMIALCSKRFPGGDWRIADMRTLELGRRFAAIIAWDSFFHLDADAQRGMFAIFRRHLTPRGRLLFTSGPAAGEAIGPFFGHQLYHASLDAEEYRRLLSANGMRVLRYDVENPDCGGHTVWLADVCAS